MGFQRNGHSAFLRVSVFAAFLMFAVLITGVSACNHDSTTAPAPIIQPPPPGANTAPLPGGGGTFSWWAPNINPVVDAQITVGQQVFLQVKCGSPSGFTYLVKMEFSGGPNTIPYSGITGSMVGGNTSSCAIQNNQMNYTVTADMPKPLYYRYTVWLRAGENQNLGGPGFSQIGPPDTVVEQYLGWHTMP